MTRKKEFLEKPITTEGFFLRFTDMVWHSRRKTRMSQFFKVTVHDRKTLKTFRILHIYTFKYQNLIFKKKVSTSVFLSLYQLFLLMLLLALLS